MSDRSDQHLVFVILAIRQLADRIYKLQHVSDSGCSAKPVRLWRRLITRMTHRAIKGSITYHDLSADQFYMSNIEQRLKKYALYLLGRRAYSVYEMREKIKEKIKKVEKYKNRKRLLELDAEQQAVILGQRSEDLTQNEILPSSGSMTVLTDKIINYLTDLQLLNDETYAKTLAQSLLRLNKSSRVIQNKLKQKGIDKEIIEKVFAKDEVKEKDSLAKLINSKLRHSPDLLSSKKGKEKLIRFLLYRGFSYADIRKEIEAAR